MEHWLGAVCTSVTLKSLKCTTRYELHPVTKWSGDRPAPQRLVGNKPLDAAVLLLRLTYLHLDCDADGSGLDGATQVVV